MSYFKPYINETGIHVPEYDDILSHLLDNFRHIFGQDLYLGMDSQDYQMISLFADAYDDALGVVVESYNNRNPNYARGNSLDMAIAANNLVRKMPTYSTVVLRLTGEEGTQIAAGSEAVDVNNNVWVIGEDVTIPSGGSIDVDAVAKEIGELHAGAGAINKIGTPTAGWVSVTNPAAAVAGQNRETDAEVRARREFGLEMQAVGTAVALHGALSAVEGVLRVRVYENMTATTDDNGIPAHSICAVVGGGTDQDIAETIALKKSPGCGLYGNETVQVPGLYGDTMDIKFTRSADVDVEVAVEIRWLGSASDAIKADIKRLVSDNINKSKIGVNLQVGLLWAVVVGANPDGGPVFAPLSVKVKKTGGDFSTSEIVAAYNERFACDVDDVTVTAV